MKLWACCTAILLQHVFNFAAALNGGVPGVKKQLDCAGVVTTVYRYAVYCLFACWLGGRRASVLASIPCCCLGWRGTTQLFKYAPCPLHIPALMLQHLPGAEPAVPAACRPGSSAHAGGCPRQCGDAWVQCQFCVRALHRPFTHLSLNCDPPIPPLHTPAPQAQVSEDHCWLQLGAGQRETTVEVTTDTAAKRGLPVTPDAWRGWLYTGGHAVLCSPHQALAALVTSINPSVTGGKKGVSAAQPLVRPIVYVLTGLLMVAGRQCRMPHWQRRRSRLWPTIMVK